MQLILAACSDGEVTPVDYAVVFLIDALVKKGVPQDRAIAIVAERLFRDQLVGVLKRIQEGDSLPVMLSLALIEDRYVTLLWLPDSQKAPVLDLRTEELLEEYPLPVFVDLILLGPLYRIAAEHLRKDVSESADQVPESASS